MSTLCLRLAVLPPSGPKKSITAVSRGKKRRCGAEILLVGMRL